MPRITDTSKTRGRDTNPDPISGECGTHPIGAGLDAAAEGVAAGVTGGSAGKEIAESIDATIEDAYWRSHHTGRPYYDRCSSYEDYKPAYRHGWESRSRYHDRTFKAAEPELEREWEAVKESSKLDWQKAKNATRDAWDRIDQYLHHKANSPK